MITLVYIFMGCNKVIQLDNIPNVGDCVMLEGWDEVIPMTRHPWAYVSSVTHSPFKTVPFVKIELETFKRPL